MGYKLLHFKIQFENCFNCKKGYTIAEGLEEVGLYLKAAKIFFDDPKSDAKVTISRIGISEEEFKIFKEQNPPMILDR